MGIPHKRENAKRERHIWMANKPNLLGGKEPELQGKNNVLELEIRKRKDRSTQI